MNNIIKSLFLMFLPNVKTFYKKDQLGIMNRYMRESENWESHLNNTKQYILDNLNIYPKQKVLIMGSGWLLDFPIELFENKDVDFYLWDINHPQQLKNKYKKFENVFFKEVDVTCGLVDIAEKSNTLSEFNTTLDKFNEFHELIMYDKVISLNILSQLHTLIIEFLETKFIVFDTDKITISNRIHDFHISMLPKGKSILITDYVEKTYCMQTKEIEEKAIVSLKFDNLEDIRKWSWDFDTKQRYYKGKNTKMDVVAGCV